MNRQTILAVSAVAVLIAAALVIIPLQNSPLQDFRMTLLGDRVQEVDYGDTADYLIYVKNTGERTRVMHLHIMDIPAGWHASLDREYLTLAPNSAEIVTLSVRAPDTVGDNALRVAEVGVRGGNATVGTITIIKGSVSVYRDGNYTPLANGDNIISGDELTVNGSAKLTLQKSKLFSNVGDAKGEIYIVLFDAKAGFVVKNDSAYMWVQKGKAVVYAPCGGGGGKGVSPLPVVNLSRMKVVEDEFPNREYHAVLEFGPEMKDSFFALNVTPESTGVEVYRGEVKVENDMGSQTVERFQHVSADESTTIPEPLPLDRQIILVSSDGAVEESVNYDSGNLINREDSLFVPLPDRNYYIAPGDLYLTVSLTGNWVGEYTVEYTRISNNAAHSFEIKSTASVNTKDTFEFSEDRVTLNNMGPGKTYDLNISSDKPAAGESKSFHVERIETSDKEQTLQVMEWSEIDSEGKDPVLFREGDKTTRIHTGMSGTDIESRLSGKTEEKSNLPYIVGSIVLVLIVIGLVAVFIYEETEPEMRIRSVNPPKETVQNETSIITMKVRNNGPTVKKKKHTVNVILYDNYEALDEKKLGLFGKPFMTREVRKIVFHWTPTEQGTHLLHFAVDVDDYENDIVEEKVEVKKKEEPGEDEDLEEL